MPAMGHQPNNIFAGTRVVSLVEVRGTNNSLVHPRGAVRARMGWTTTSPTPTGADLQWSLFGAPEQFEDNTAQSCYWELQKFLAMALKANPNILECLYSPMFEKVTPLGAELLAMRDAFLSQMIFQTFNGYAMSQFKKIEQDIRNHGEVR